MKLDRPTIVIFDMDGTTVRHLNPWVLALCEKYDDTAYRVSKFFGWVFKRHARGPIIPAMDLERQRTKPPRLLVHRAIHKMRRKGVEQIVEPCPGIYSVLNLLKSNKIPMALVSNGLGKGYGHEVLSKFDLEKYYGATVFREDIQKSKPNPEPLLLAVRELGLRLKSTDVIWYIGDRHKDITAALAAAKHLPCKVVPIAYGINAAGAVIEKGLNKDQIILCYRDMLKDLNELFKSPSLSSKQERPEPLTGGAPDRKKLSAA